MRWTNRWSLTVALLGSLAAGCSGPPAPAPKPAAARTAETEVRGRFEELQAAFKAGDTDKLWAMLDPKSQADAEQAAKAVQAAYTVGKPEEKAKVEESLGLSAAELAVLSGKTYLRTKRFRGKFHELPESKIDKVTVQDDKATVYFDEPDGDKEKAIFLRQDGTWKVWLTIPKMSSKASEK